VSILLTVRRWKYKVCNKVLWSIFSSKLFQRRQRIFSLRKLFDKLHRFIWFFLSQNFN